MKVTYDYYNAVFEDVVNWVLENMDIIKSKNFDDIQDLSEWLYDTLWIEDSVTGNGSGSYTFNLWQAEEYLAHNLNLLADACREFDIKLNWEKLENPEELDVTIRCYCLADAVNEIVERWDEFDTLKEGVSE